MAVILASKSPRRRELLRTMGIEEFEIRPAVGEEIVPENVTPQEMVKAISRQKARQVRGTAEKEDTVIAADTLVFADGKPLGKPKDEEDAASMLRALAGREHIVCTGVTVIKGERELSQAVTTRVFFRTMTEKEIADYVKTGEPMDKAGAYGIQGRASVFVEKIDGDYFNVMGLPVCTLSTMLQRLSEEEYHE